MSAAMRAAVLVEPGRFEVRHVPMPRPASTEVLIRVHRCGICGTDAHIFNGHYAAENLPLIPGHEFAGVVAEVGADVRSVRPGQKAVADINVGCGKCFYCRRNEVLNCTDVHQMGITMPGAFAEYVTVPERLVIAAPDDMAMEDLALVEPIACVVRAARSAGVGLGQSVVVLGAGPIGNLHIQLMRLVGAMPVVAVEPLQERGELASRAGADIVVNEPAKAREIVLHATDGRGADVVIESVGLPALYEQALDLIRPGGHVVAFGLTGQGDTIALNLLNMILRETTIRGSVAGMGQDMHDALNILRFGRFDTAAFTASAYPITAIQDAFETLTKRPAVLKTQIEI